MTPQPRDKAERLASIILMLRVNASLTAEQLANRLDVTVRTIYRDVDALIESGVPIRASAGPSGGYTLAEHYPVDPFVYVQADPPFSPARHAAGTRNALTVATELVSRGLPADDQRRIRDLSERFLFDTTSWFWQDSRLSGFSTLKDAVLGNHAVELVYVDRRGATILTKEVDPYGMVWRQGHWYVISRDRESKRVERHRVSRVIGVRKLEETFVRPSDFNLEKTWARLLDDFGRGRRLVRLRIDAPATNDFESFAWKDDQVITKYTDHWIVELRLDDDEWLVPLVLSYGGLVQVLEPASLRERVVVALESALRLHRVGDEQS